MDVPRGEAACTPLMDRVKSGGQASDGFDAIPPAILAALDGYFRNPKEGLRVAVAPGASAGPVAVSASTPQRPLGVWTVAPGGNGAFFGLPGAGEVTLTWRLPGGEPQKKTVSVDGKPVRIVIDK